MSFLKGDYKRTRGACYFSYISSASVFILPSILFLTFREMYGISFTLLGTLVLVNFCTQLSIDLAFSFFPKYFNLRAVTKAMPLLTSAGMAVYALVPLAWPQHAFGGMLLGTLLFSVSAGLCEVLISPIVAALPSDDPQRDMSLLHSLYAWGALTVVGVSTLFLALFGGENWNYLALFFASLPLITFFLFATSPLPPMELSHPEKGKAGKEKRNGILLCVICIFLGSAAENAMTNWISTYMEGVLHIPKTVCDILGLALFALLLGTGRVLYAKFGRSISTVILWGMVGAAVCYVVAGLATNPVVAVIAAVLTGFCTSMLWPGTLIMMEENIPHPGVTAYALMAAGGDLGGSVAPQLLGAVADGVALSAAAGELAARLSMTPEQLGLRAGLLLAAVFPLLGIAVVMYIKHFFKNKA